MNEIEWLDMIEEIKLHKGGCPCCGRKAELVDGICNQCYHTGFSPTGMAKKMSKEYDIELEVNEKEKQQLIIILNKNNMYYTSKDKSIKIHLYGCFKGVNHGKT